jgi:hypothetical protein
MLHNSFGNAVFSELFPTTSIFLVNFWFLSFSVAIVWDVNKYSQELIQHLAFGCHSITTLPTRHRLLLLWWWWLCNKLKSWLSIPLVNAMAVFKMLSALASVAPELDFGHRCSKLDSGIQCRNARAVSIHLSMQLWSLDTLELLVISIYFQPFALGMFGSRKTKENDKSTSKLHCNCRNKTIPANWFVLRGFFPCWFFTSTTNKLSLYVFWSRLGRDGPVGSISRGATTTVPAPVIGHG